ncbi:bone morphogenetic protein 15 [Antechinus flavipes]|uniref:bone morphogenetic protein 15 n=1 Tax=Antechinus flavipes TaxID=38775 RepID=UPI002236452D|nr:bone morphogenetic protein 15 [Antechinus flavipes]
MDPTGMGWPLWALLFALGLSSPGGARARDAVTPAQVPTLLPLVRALLREGPRRPPRRQLSLERPVQYMLELYRQNADSQGHPRGNRVFHANVVRLVRPAARRVLPRQGPWYVQTLDFLLQPNHKVDQLLRAAITYCPSLHLSRSHFSCHVEPWAPKSTILPGGGSPGLILPETWAEMDLTNYIQRQVWPQKGRGFLRIQVRCQQREKTKVGLGWRQALTSDTAFLVLYLNNTFKNVPRIRPQESLVEEPGGTDPLALALTRQVRQVGPVRSEMPRHSQEQTHCALYPFQVSFSQLGWDSWVIAPRRYNLNYCKGICPWMLHSGFHSPNHAIIQNLINTMVDSNVPRSSCVPYKYTPISILLIEASGSILYKEFEDMIAESCTCR